ncbi:MAG: 2-dehydropantoate 2-reductase N-terminal domain-containing protein, partial [Pseudomonadota bacterium]
MTAKQITVFGAGSIGCYLGGRLASRGQSVRLIGRTKLQTVVQEHGLTLSQFDEDPVHLTDIVIATTPDALKGSDVVALCVKSQDTEDAAQHIQTYAPTAHVISFQNGVSNLSVLRRHLPDANISGCVVPFNVTSPKPGHFHRGTDGDLLIGPHAPEAIIAAFQESGVGARAVKDIDGYLWAKLLVNLNNALNTLSGGP